MKGILLLMMATLFISGCAINPSVALDQRAADSGMQRSLQQGQDFQHLIYTQHLSRVSDTLHVYIEGDGAPFIARYFIAGDPTTRYGLMLALMARDDQPALYLGRPCYHGLAEDDTACDERYWTSARYSTQVVESMQAVLKTWLQRHPYQRIIFIGHSGGGALAMLLAPKFEQTRGVITLAGNLDTDGWTQMHGYSPLYASLNPSKQPRLSYRIQQRHFAGGKDTNIPPQLIEGALTNPLQLDVIDDYTHECCWHELWPDILNSFDQDTSVGCELERRGIEKHQ